MRSFTRSVNQTKGRRRDEVGVALLAAVESLLADGHQYAELSVVRLADAAGLSRSTFYRYYADKGELLLGLTEDVISGLAEAGRVLWELPVTASRAEITEAVHALLALGHEHRMMLRAIVDAEAYDAAVRERRGFHLAGAVAYVAEHIARGQAAGWIRPQLDAETTANWLCTMADRGLVSLVGPATPEAINRLTESLTQILWFTLYDGYREPLS